MSGVRHYRSASIHPIDINISQNPYTGIARLAETERSALECSLLKTKSVVTSFCTKVPMMNERIEAWILGSLLVFEVLIAVVWLS